VFQKLAAETGSSHDLLDLWWHKIPTLSEYGQGISKGLMFYVSEMLHAPADAKETAFAFPRLLVIDLLKSMGVRFVISDTPLSQDIAIVRQTVGMKDGINLILYELPNPNLGTFSPVKLTGNISPDALTARIGADPALFQTEAFVDAEAAQELVPAHNATVVFEKGSIHVTATSTGTSALLLPVQFSRCFRLVDQASGFAKILRANLLHTLVVFTGSLDVRLQWNFNFWQNSECRAQDAREAHAAGLR
jgi:hypothetical protein